MKMRTLPQNVNIDNGIILQSGVQIGAYTTVKRNAYKAIINGKQYSGDRIGMIVKQALMEQENA